MKHMAVGMQPPHQVAVHIIDCAWLRLGAWRYDRLASPYWRFYWNADKGASVLLDGHRTQLIPSRCFLIPPQTPFATRLDHPVRHFCLHFVTAPSRLRLAPGIYGFPHSEARRKTISEIRRHLESRNEPTLHASLLCLALVHDALASLPPGRLAMRQEDERIESVLRIMEARLSAPPPVADLAQRLNLHVNTFIRIFKQVTGHTPRDYHHHLRMERAVLLLLSTRSSIEEIAEEVGFCDRYHFSRAFSRMHGVGPARFRGLHGSTGATTAESRPPAGGSSAGGSI